MWNGCFFFSYFWRNLRIWKMVFIRFDLNRDKKIINNFIYIFAHSLVLLNRWHLPIFDWRPYRTPNNIKSQIHTQNVSFLRKKNVFGLMIHFGHHEHIIWLLLSATWSPFDSIDHQIQPKNYIKQIHRRDKQFVHN